MINIDTENFIMISCLVILVGINIYNLFYRQRRRKKKYRVYGQSSSSNTQYYLDKHTQASDKRFSLIEDRLDKLEIDTTFLKDYTIKKQIASSSKDTKNLNLDKSEDISSSLVDLLKEKENKKGFTNEELDEEIKRKVCQHIFKNPTLLKDQRDKAYKRLYSKVRYNKKQNK